MGSQSLDLRAQSREHTSSEVDLPAPTAWPVVLAFGFALLFAGLVTNASVTILGAILCVGGCIGWFREVLPHERHESVSAVPDTTPVVTSRPEVARVEPVTHEINRARMPLEIYPVVAGVKGGLAGCVAMALLAMTYGIVSKHGIWYPINLLSIGFFPTRDTTAEIAAFHWDGLAIATIVHLLCSLLVGLLYGATLPIFSRRPILLGGLVAPILWSGLLHSFLEAINPVLNQRIDWLWFVISQIGFGIVAGIVVSRQERVHTWQYLPFAARAGIEEPRVMDEKSGEDRPQ